MIKEMTTSGVGSALTADDLPVHLPPQRIDRDAPYASLELPKWRCVSSTLYRFYGADRQPLYIGQTTVLSGRFDDHRRYSAWWPKVEYVAVSIYAGYNGALEHEKAAIRREQPRFNRQGLRGRKYQQLHLHGPAEEAAALLFEQADPEFITELASLLRQPERFPQPEPPPLPRFADEMAT
ncbi:GIY-YIG nuclease family protein [Streptomyces sp. NPDC056291]|uniref:GIY-YIG nuclease family protein n=1 Tax=Streptomyces sp. NPDC056291 TaxID=3345772 RepID=UPI0035DD7D9D